MPTPKLISSTGQIWSDFAATEMPSAMLRQKLGCSTGGCGGGSGSRHTARHPTSTRPACRNSSGTAPKRSAVEAQAMPRSWPMNCKRRGERHRTRQPDALGDDRQQGIAGGNGEGADGAGRDAVGDQQGITEARPSSAPRRAPAAARRRACGSAAEGGAGCRDRRPCRPTAGRAATAPSGPPGPRPRRRHPCAARPRPATGTAPSGCRAARTRCRGPADRQGNGSGGGHGPVLIRGWKDLYLVRT